MTRSKVSVLTGAMLIAATLLFMPRTPSKEKDAARQLRILSRARARRRAEDAFATGPLSFEPNQGQAARGVRFLARGNGYTLLLARDEAVMALDDQQTQQASASALQKLNPKQRARFEKTRYFRLSPRFSSVRKSEYVRIVMKGANPDATVEALKRLPGTSNYFLGRDPHNWRTGIPTYAQVKYEQVYPGIDLVYYGNRQRPEFDFLLAPGANPNNIHLVIDAKGSLRVTADGSLQLTAGHGVFELLRPRIYQTVAGRQKPIRGGFVLKTKNQVGIELAQYDPTRAVTIDPTLSYSTYFGGTGTEEADGIAVDSTGNIYVVGTTTATDFPTLNGYPAGPPSGNTMAYVSKFDSSGTTLLYSTYLGGSGDETVGAIAVDQSGNAYIAGSTTSPDFPVVNAFQNALGGTKPNAFVARIDTTKTGSASLVFSTYLGGGGNASNPYGDAAFGIAIDGSGDAYVVGQASSDSSKFHTWSTYQSTLNSQNGNAFLSVIDTNPGSGSLLYSTYLGGDGAGIFGDYATAVALNSSGDAFITGQTSSDSSEPFPTTSSAYQTSLRSPDGNIFISEINPQNGPAGLLYSTYLGGSDNNLSDPGDEGDGIAVDALGHTYISGSASSADFPTTTGAFDTTNSSVGKAIVAKLDTTKSGSASLLYSTFLGGSNGNGEVGNAIAVDSSGDAFVVGATGSTNFPTANGPAQATLLSSAFDGYFSELNPGASSLLYSTFLGGSCAQGDSAYSMALDTSGDSYVSGETCSSNFPVTTGAYQSSLQGAQNGFMVEFAAGDATPAFSLSAASGSNCPSGGNCSSSATVQAGQTATYNLQLEPLNGFSGVITLRCGDTLIESTCSANPGSITLNGNQTPAFTVTVTTSPSIAAIPLSVQAVGKTGNRLLLSVCLLLALALCLFASRLSAQRSRRRAIPVFILFFASLLVVGGCAATNAGLGLGTRSGTVTVTGTSSSGVSYSSSLILNVN